MDQISLNIPSLPDNIRIVESFIDNAKERFEINDDIYGNIMISVTEAVNNAIIHGNGKDASKMVQLTLCISEKELTFKIADEGNGFDYDSLPDPTAIENLEKIGGRGIFLIRNLSDELKFEEDGKILVMKFNMA